MFPVAAAADVGWLILFVLLLAAPPPRRRRDGAGGPEQVRQDDAPPAVVSLLAGRLGRYGFGATLLDLAARGWFRLSPAPPGPVMCVVCAEPPDERLTPYERRVVAHVGLRAGARGEVPRPALAEGFAGGEAEFMKEFREEVDADARQRGLTRPRLSPGRIAVLCVLLFVPAGMLLASIDPVHRKAAWAYLGFSYFFAFGLTIKTGTSRRCSAAGRAARRRWREAVAQMPGGGGRPRHTRPPSARRPPQWRSSLRRARTCSGQATGRRRGAGDGLGFLGGERVLPAADAWHVRARPGQPAQQGAGERRAGGTGRDQPVLTVIVRHARAPLGPGRCRRARGPSPGWTAATC